VKAPQAKKIKVDTETDVDTGAGSASDEESNEASPMKNGRKKADPSGKNSGKAQKSKKVGKAQGAGSSSAKKGGGNAAKFSKDPRTIGKRNRIQNTRYGDSSGK
jgi:hypothetical protein